MDNVLEIRETKRPANRHLRAMMAETYLVDIGSHAAKIKGPRIGDILAMLPTCLGGGQLRRGASRRQDRTVSGHCPPVLLLAVMAHMAGGPVV